MESIDHLIVAYRNGIEDGLAKAERMQFLPDPVRVIANGPATVAFFSDGTKTVVKLAEGDAPDPEKAVMAALLKRYKRGWQDAVRACEGGPEL